MKPRVPGLVAAAICLGVGLAGLSGCGRSTDTGSAPTKTSESETNKGSTEYVESQGAISDLTDFVCKKDVGVWSFRGTLKNPSNKDRTYDVLLAIVKPKTSEVVAQKTLHATVKPGKSKNLTAENLYSGKTTMVCTPVVTLAR